MKDCEKILIEAIKSTVCMNDVRYKIPENQVENVWDLACSHGFPGIVADIMINDSDYAKVKDFFKNEIFNLIKSSEKRNIQLDTISKIFTEKNIPFIVLKGGVIKDFYPKDWYRTSSDLDILVKEADLEAGIDALVQNNYYICDRSGHDISLKCDNGSVVELHYVLVEIIKDAIPILDKVWEYSYKDGDHWKMTPEFFMYYHILHTAKHFINGGCGIKPFIDMWLIEKNMEIDYKLLENLLEKSGLLTFYKKIHYVMNVWFENCLPNESSERITKYIMEGGVYGNINARVAMHRGDGGKLNYILGRLFVPMYKLKASHSILKKHPYLAPYFQVKRWIKVVTSGRVIKTANEIGINESMSEEELSFISDLKKDLDI